MSDETKNLLLSTLSPEPRNRLLNYCVPVDLPLRAPLFEAEHTPSHAFFMTSGMASVVVGMKEGSTAEVGIIGNEGLVGGVHLLGSAKVSTTSFIQLEGSALKIPLEELRRAIRSSEEIRHRFLEFQQEQFLTVSQIAACNRLHEAEARLARWLLMAQDRVQSDVLNFTQEFLGMMLGARRTTVTVVAGTLQKAGCIEYSRGKVKITNRQRLVSSTCDCYGVTQGLLAGLYKHPWSRDGDLHP